MSGKMNKEYDYCIITRFNSQSKNIHDSLKELGRDGWKLASTFPCNEKETTFVFMQEIDRNDKRAMDERIVNRYRASQVL
jgi:hypothetical protein